MYVDYTSIDTPLKTYSKGAKLAPDTWYEDSCGALVITDCAGKPAAVFMDDGVIHPSSIDWPLVETSINKVTITR